MPFAIFFFYMIKHWPILHSNSFFQDKFLITYVCTYVKCIIINSLYFKINYFVSNINNLIVDYLIKLYYFNIKLYKTWTNVFRTSWLGITLINLSFYVFINKYKYQTKYMKCDLMLL